MAPPAERRACIFCGASDRKISKEHLWSRWMREHIDGAKGGPIGHARLHRTRDHETRRRDEFRDIPVNWQISGPCASCNEGWMERIEAAARPALIPMLEDRPAELDPVAQWTLAKWVTLKILIAQHGHPGVRTIPEARYREFHRTREPLGGAQIWAGRYDGSGPWPTHYRHHELFVLTAGGRDPAAPNAYFVAFHVGYAAFVYWGHEIKDLRITDLAGLKPFLVPIWPALASTTWPPDGLLGADALDAVFRGFPIS